jgi:4a-hydroxytetrahydrobiopterin dehydratase
MTTTAQHPLDDASLRHELGSLPGWSHDRSALVRSFRFPSFLAAIEFMRASAADIDRRNHHPEWSNVYQTVTIRLTTHDAGNKVTKADVELAHYLDRMAKTQGAK